MTLGDNDNTLLVAGRDSLDFGGSVAFSPRAASLGLRNILQPPLLVREPPHRRRARAQEPSSPRQRIVHLGAPAASTAPTVLSAHESLSHDFLLDFSGSDTDIDIETLWRTPIVSPVRSPVNLKDVIPIDMQDAGALARPDEGEVCSHRHKSPGWHLTFNTAQFDRADAERAAFVLAQQACPLFQAPGSGCTTGSPCDSCAAVPVSFRALAEAEAPPATLAAQGLERLRI